MTQYEKMARLRDELRLKMHLAGADTRSLFEQLEQKWHRLEVKMGPVRTTSREVAGDVSEAACNLIAELYEGYRRIKSSLKKLPK